MVEPIWITAAMVQVIHDDQVATHGGAYGLRDEGLLASNSHFESTFKISDF